MQGGIGLTSHQGAPIEAAVRQMRRELDGAGSGSFRSAIQAVLTRRLPSHRYRITSGVVAGNGDENIVDGPLVLVDAATSPVMPLDENGGELLLADAVHGAIQIVDFLDADSLKSAIDSVRSLKRLKRPPMVDEGRVQNPYIGAVIARSGMPGEALLKAVAKANQALAFSEQIDLICVLDQGIITFVEVDPDGSITIELPVQASARWRLGWISLGEDAFLAFYLILWQTLAAQVLRAPSIYPLLRMLSTSKSSVIPDPQGTDPGE